MAANPAVAIIGAGIAGLAAAATLRKIGIPAVNGDATHNFFPDPGTGGVDPAYGIVEICSTTYGGGACTYGGFPTPAETIAFSGTMPPGRPIEEMTYSG